MYVKDVVRAYLDLAEHLGDVRTQGQAFNFAPGQPISVLDLVGQIQKLMGCELEMQILGKAQAEIHSQYLDSTKAEQILGWRPIYSLDKGLAETIDWYRVFWENSSR